MAGRCLQQSGGPSQSRPQAYKSSSRHSSSFTSPTALQLPNGTDNLNFPVSTVLRGNPGSKVNVHHKFRTCYLRGRPAINLAHCQVSGTAYGTMRSFFQPFLLVRLFLGMAKACNQVCWCISNYHATNGASRMMTWSSGLGSVLLKLSAWPDVYSCSPCSLASIILL